MLFLKQLPLSSVTKGHTAYALILLMLLSACKSEETETSWNDIKLPDPSETTVEQFDKNGEDRELETFNGEQWEGNTSSRETQDIEFITSLLKQKHKWFAAITQTLINKTTTYNENHRYPLDCINFCCAKIWMGDDEYKKYFDAYIARLLKDPNRLWSKEYRYIKSAWIEVNPKTERYFIVTEGYIYLFDINKETNE